MQTTLQVERLGEFSSSLGMPIEEDGVLNVVASNGDVYKYQDGKFQVKYRLGGQPSCIAFDPEQNVYYLADMAHQAVLANALDEKKEGPDLNLISENEQGLPFLGPNCVIISLNLNALFFTDSGPFGETSSENPRGSVYMFDIDMQKAKSLAYNSLAYPSGLVLSNDEKSLFVCETCKNRVLRFVPSNNGPYYFSVLYQFSGRFGPISVGVSQQDLLYVARYEFSQVSHDGVISVVNQQGQLLDTILLPGLPEISGISFSSTKANLLYITENWTRSVNCVLVHQDEKDDPKRKNDVPLKSLLK